MSLDKCLFTFDTLLWMFLVKTCTRMCHVGEYDVTVLNKRNFHVAGLFSVKTRHRGAGGSRGIHCAAFPPSSTVMCRSIVLRTPPGSNLKRSKPPETSIYSFEKYFAWSVTHYTAVERWWW